MKCPTLFSLASAACLIAAFSLEAKSTSKGVKTLTEVEKWVVHQVSKGDIADLTTHFPNETERTLSARFLQQLLTHDIKGLTPHRNGIRINGALINEPVDLGNAQFTSEIWLDHCKFNGPVIFAHAIFPKALSLEGTFFAKVANFNSVKVGGDVNIGKAVFEGPVDFNFADIARVLAANDAQFKNKEHGAGFNTIKVGHSAFFMNACFEGPADFGSAQINGILILDEAQFNSKEQLASFNSMKATSAFLHKTVFEAPVDFVVADIQVNLEAEGAQFKNQGKGVTFDSMKVGHEARFTDVVFEGPVTFASIDVRGILNADRARFRNKEQPANFNGMKVGRGAYFHHTIFDGPADFGSVEIGGLFVMNEGQFCSVEKLVDFNGIKIGDSAFFMETLFEGPVSFLFAQVTGVFQADRAQFCNEKTGANFNSMKVKSAFFKETVFEGPVDFIAIDVAESFTVRDAQFRNEEATVNLDSAKIGRGFFTQAIFKGIVQMGYSQFAFLELSRTQWPVDPDSFVITGMSYKALKAGTTKPKSNEALLKTVNQAHYTADVYGRLEAFFLSEGYRDDADGAFIAGRCRERDETLEGWRWFYSWFVYLLSAYGRRPWQAGIPCIVLIVIGCVLFSPGKMEARKSDGILRYNRFWYSVGLFFPFVDLRVDKEWQPKPEHPSLISYIPFHMLFGWILVPIAVAALTGLLK